MKIQRVVAVMIGIVLPLLAAGAQAAELKVYASTAVKAVLQELGPQFEKATGNQLVFTFGPAAVMKKQIDEGAAFDVAILTPALTDGLATAGKIDPASRVAIARAAAVPARSKRCQHGGGAQADALAGKIDRLQRRRRQPRRQLSRHVTALRACVKAVTQRERSAVPNSTCRRRIFVSNKKLQPPRDVPATFCCDQAADGEGDAQWLFHQRPIWLIHSQPQIDGPRTASRCW